MDNQGPPAVNNLFAVSQASWEAISKRAFLFWVNFTQDPYAESYVAQFRPYADLSLLQVYSQRWHDSQFGELQDFVRTMLAFAPSMITLRQHFEALEVHDADYAANKALARQYLHDTVLPALGAIIQQATTLQQAIAAFVGTNLAADNAPGVTLSADNDAFYGLTTTSSDLIVHDDDYHLIDQALGAVAAGWGQLATDLADVATQLANTDPNSDFIERIRVLGADTTWNSTISGAQTFLAMAPALSRCFDGSYLYDNQPVVPGAWYYVGLDFANNGNLYSLYADRMTIPMKNNPKINFGDTQIPPYNEDAYQWQFKPTGCGYFQVFNKMIGPDQALAVLSPDGVYAAPLGSNIYSLDFKPASEWDSRQNWRFFPSANGFVLVPLQLAPSGGLCFNGQFGAGMPGWLCDDLQHQCPMGPLRFSAV